MRYGTPRDGISMSSVDFGSIKPQPSLSPRPVPATVPTDSVKKLNILKYLHE